MSEFQKLKRLSVMVALEKRKLYDIIEDAFRKNGGSLILKKRLGHGLVLTETSGSRREDMVSIHENDGKSIVSMPASFQGPITNLLRNKGVTFHNLISA